MCPARAVLESGLSPNLGFDILWNMSGSNPAPHEFIMNSGTDRFARECATQREYGGSDLTAYVMDYLRYAHNSFLMASGGSDMGTEKYVEVLADNPMGIPSWVRLLLGFQWKYVVDKHMVPAWAYFKTRPDLVRVCMGLGYDMEMLTGGAA